MYKEMNEYLKSVKAANAWNEEEVASTIKSILNHYMGVPPVSITIKGEKLTPKEYLDKVLKLKLDDYVDIISVLSEPFYQKIEYKVSDNWWHSKDYYNVTLNEYMDAIKSAVRKGYTICIGGDVSEAGIESHAKVAIIPSFDIPSQYIDEYAREFRINNKTTADDHGIHLVGYVNKNNKDWYLIKDSGAGSKNKEPKGYYFFHEDYVKLKIVDFMIHKDAVKNLLEKFNK
jgi:Aminopeptidase C